MKTGADEERTGQERRGDRERERDNGVKKQNIYTQRQERESERGQRLQADIFDLGHFLWYVCMLWSVSQLFVILPSSLVIVVY